MTEPEVPFYVIGALVTLYSRSDLALARRRVSPGRSASARDVAGTNIRPPHGSLVARPVPCQIARCYAVKRTSLTTKRA